MRFVFVRSGGHGCRSRSAAPVFDAEFVVETKTLKQRLRKTYRLRSSKATSSRPSAQELASAAPCRMETSIGRTCYVYFPALLGMACELAFLGLVVGDSERRAYFRAPPSCKVRMEDGSPASSIDARYLLVHFAQLCQNDHNSLGLQSEGAPNVLDSIRDGHCARFVHEGGRAVVGNSGHRSSGSVTLTVSISPSRGSYGMESIACDIQFHRAGTQARPDATPMVYT